MLREEPDKETVTWCVAVGVFATIPLLVHLLTLALPQENSHYSILPDIGVFGFVVATTSFVKLVACNCPQIQWLELLKLFFIGSSVLLAVAGTMGYILQSAGYGNWTPVALLTVVCTVGTSVAAYFTIRYVNRAVQVFQGGARP
jgi:hypothetical protein